MKRGAIFDMDGLLFDTEKVYQEAWLVTADAFGVARHPELGKACCGTCGDLTLRIIRRFYPNVDAQDYMRRVIAYVNAETDRHLPVMAGVRDILSYFQAHGVKMSTASSANAAQVEKILCRAVCAASSTQSSAEISWRAGNRSRISFCARLSASDWRLRTVTSLRTDTTACAGRPRRGAVP